MALLPVAEALARILKTARTQKTERLPLSKALGRITAAPIKAKHNQPPFDASAMDGYAVRHADLTDLPVTLKQVGTSAAGNSFKGTLKPGQCVRIFTGAPVPKGADTIVIQENVKTEGNIITFAQAIEKARHIRKAGLDFTKGSELLPAGKRLTARDIGLAAAADHATIIVRKKPLIAILSTGDELALPGTKRRPDQITSSNNFALAAFASACGCDVLDLGLVKDDLKSTIIAIKKTSNADILLTTGGASVGEHDFVQEALIKSGVKIDFWKIAMRPGKPFMFGTKGNLRVLGLPGNPVAAITCALLFLKPLIATMLGQPQDDHKTFARLTTDLTANDQRQDYLRASLARISPDETNVTPAQTQDSSMQATLQSANCLIIRPAFSPPAKSGDLVEIMNLPPGI